MMPRLRMMCKPLNGETAFVDTAAAFATLPERERDYLETLRVLRRMDDRDPGFTAPLVRTNPLSGLKSLHSPWNCRRGGVPDLEIHVSWIRGSFLHACIHLVSPTPLLLAREYDASDPACCRMHILAGRA